jgi:uncharacterized SAM-binding protein YcdF (DUF218 family)
MTRLRLLTRSLILLALALLATLLAAGLASAGPPGAANLYDSAQRCFGGGDVRGGLDWLARAEAIDPGNRYVLALRAFWASEQLDIAAREDSLARLAVLDRPLRDRVLGAIDAVTAAGATPPDPFPSLQGPRTAIVVLGYGLLPDGTMRPELVDRLRAAWAEAIASPLSPIVTTGGNPHNGVTEGQAMAGWLIADGIPAWRIHPETRAGSTVQNALFSAPVIRAVGADSAVIVTSADHLRRGMADFAVAGIRVVGGTAAYSGLFTAPLSPLHLAAQLRPLTPPEEHSMYLDATRVLDLPADL